MKKFILLLAALFTLAMSTTAFAAPADNGAVLNKEEAAATKLVNALLQNGNLLPYRICSIRNSRKISMITISKNSKRISPRNWAL